MDGERIEGATVEELERLAARIAKELDLRRGEPPGKAGWEVVERRASRGRWLQLEMVKCGKWGRCNKCRLGDGHGPYYYLYHTNPKTGKRTSKYVGKPENLTPELAQEFEIGDDEQATS